MLLASSFTKLALSNKRNLHTIKVAVHNLKLLPQQLVLLTQRVDLVLVICFVLLIKPLVLKHWTRVLRQIPRQRQVWMIMLVARHDVCVGVMIWLQTLSCQDSCHGGEGGWQCNLCIWGLQ